MNAEAKRGPAPALVWVKSSYSGAEGGQCVEVAVCPGKVHVRDSKDIARAALAVEPAAWVAFLEFAAR
ncbi:DUF397 domain-containing protein [Streptomyces sp. TRM43335]|uniref:DUF397 domain-containing protein n=1 Tax=Streptomyces taklimakanensis TaxID=2569853 RepID=A0A6G2BHC8_9ACTN|nr:DUF397 domain-containing protein [Streptomyces taklimakanensis]MTE21668.1 DUF397 domain-containing protein [Streptomyces taklimakanensis]